MGGFGPPGAAWGGGSRSPGLQGGPLPSQASQMRKPVFCSSAPMMVRRSHEAQHFTFRPPSGLGLSQTASEGRVAHVPVSVAPAA